MRSVGAHEAKTNLARLLDEVAQGHTILITRHGVPVAELVPYATRRVGVDQAIRDIRTLRTRTKSLDGKTVRDLIDEGRRF